MTARRPRMTPEMFVPDPLADAQLAGQAGVAEQLSRVLESLQGFDQGSVMGYLYRKPPLGVGKFEFAERMVPPTDPGELLEGVKEKYGGGDYRLQVFAGGKTRGNCEFSVMGPPKPIVAPGAPPAAADPMAGGGLLAMMLNMQAESRRESMDQQRFFMEQQQARTTALLQAAGIAIPVLAPLLFGNREKLADIIALMNANKPVPNNLKETVETITLVKGLFGDGDKPAGFDPDDMVGSIARLAGPMIGAAGRAFNGRGAPGGQGEEPPPAFGDGTLQLPPPDPRAPAPTPGAQPANPVLALIRPHVLYFYSASLDPGLAAEAVVDIMQRAGVGDGDLNDLVAAFTLAADWKGDLAAQGIDLRANPEWADDFLNELVAAWTDRDRHGDDTAGRGGGVGDAPSHAQPGQEGIALDADPPPGP